MKEKSEGQDRRLVHGGLAHRVAYIQLLGVDCLHASLEWNWCGRGRDLCARRPKIGRAGVIVKGPRDVDEAEEVSKLVVVRVTAVVVRILDDVLVLVKGRLWSKEGRGDEGQPVKGGAQEARGPKR